MIVEIEVKHLFFRPFFIGNILQYGEDERFLLQLVVDHRGGQMGPDDASILAYETFVHGIRFDFFRQHLPHVLIVQRQIFRMGDLRECQMIQFFRRISDDFAVFSIHPAIFLIDRPVTDPDLGLFENGAEELFVAF